MSKLSNKLSDKFQMGEKLRKNFMALIILAVSGSIIYGLPYFRYDYYDAYVTTYHLTNTQMGILGSIFGVFGMISYLFGGYVADKFSLKKLLTVSLIGTGIGGLIHLLPLSFWALACLYAFWGFSSLFAFWPACVKAVRMMSDSSDQGKAFGFFEGGRGIAAAITAPLAVLIFGIGVKQLNDALGMKLIIIFYSVATILCGILVFFKMKDESVESSEKIQFKDFGKVLKMPAVWIIGMVTLCNYVFCMSVYYFIPYATSLLGATVMFGATLSAFKRYLTPVSNIGGGFLGDKFGTSNLLLSSFVVMAVCTTLMIVLPLKKSMLAAFVVLYIVNYFFFNVNYSLTWAMMDEGNIPVQFSGTAAGVIATVGYLPEVFCSILAGKLMDKYPGVQGYRYYFIFLIVMLIIGAIFVIAWRNYLKKNKKQIDDKNVEDKNVSA